MCDLDANQLTAGHRVFWGCLAQYADDHHVTDDQCPVGYHTNEPFNQCVKFAPSVVGEDHDHGSGEDHEHGSGEDHEHGSGEDEDHDDHGDHDHGGDHDDRYAGAEYRSSDCSGTPVRTWNLPSFPFDEASAEGTCFTPDGYWSVGDEWWVLADFTQGGTPTPVLLALDDGLRVRSGWRPGIPATAALSLSSLSFSSWGLKTSWLRINSCSINK